MSAPWRYATWTKSANRLGTVSGDQVPVVRSTPAIARDLWTIDDADADPDAAGDTGSEASYVVQYLRRARAFAAGLAAEGRGAVYMIG